MNITKLVKLARDLSEAHNSVARLAEILIADIEFQGITVISKQEGRDLLKQFDILQGALDNITLLLEGRDT